MRLPKPHDVDPAVALGLLIIGAIDHLIATGTCCTTCCPLCAALLYYHDQLPVVADTGVEKALNGQFRDWQLDDATLNWPYLVQHWTVSDASAHVCT